MASKNQITKNGATNNSNNNNNNEISANNNNNKSLNRNENKATGKNGKKSPPKQIKAKKPKTRDSGCCSINFIKYVLIIIDIVFFVSTHLLQKKISKKLIIFPVHIISLSEHFWTVKTHAQNMDIWAFAINFSNQARNSWNALLVFFLPSHFIPTCQKTSYVLVFLHPHALLAIKTELYVYSTLESH